MKLRVTELIAKLGKENFSKLSLFSTMDSHQLPSPVCLLFLGITSWSADSSCLNLT